VDLQHPPAQECYGTAKTQSAPRTVRYPPLSPGLHVEVRTVSRRKRDAGPIFQKTSRGLTGKLRRLSACGVTFSFFALGLVLRNLVGCFFFGPGFMQLPVFVPASPPLRLGASHLTHDRLLFPVLGTVRKLSGVSAPESALRFRFRAYLWADQDAYCENPSWEKYLTSTGRTASIEGARQARELGVGRWPPRKIATRLSYPHRHIGSVT